MELKKGKKGGKREGAGRPKGTSKLYAFRADKEIANYIDSQENKTEFIKECIVSSMNARLTISFEEKQPDSKPSSKRKLYSSATPPSEF